MQRSSWRSTTSRSRRSRTSRRRSTDGAPLVHSDFGTNECYVWKLETDGVQAAIDAADVVVTRRYFQPRLIPNAMEPRGVLAQVGPTGDVTLWSATQTPHILRFALQLVLGIPESKIRVIAPDVGGGFGSKLQSTPRSALAVALARRLGRPVKWTEERAENYVATIHGRDVVHELTFAATKDGDITAVRSEALCAMGAYLELVTPGVPLLGAWIYSGPYAIPNYSVTFTGVFTHTTPTDAYRGAGRPEATYVLERTMDALARELGMDPVELRRKNFVKEFPHTMASGLTIDSGDYAASPRPAARAARSRTRSEPIRRRGARAETRSRSASASRPTTRCAGSRRRASSGRSATRSEAGTQRRSASSRSARCKW